MIHSRTKFLIALAALAGSLGAWNESRTLNVFDGSVGKDLQTYTTVTFSEPVANDLELTVTSSDPSKLLLAKTQEEAGSGSIVLRAKARSREAPDFWLQSLVDSGTATYTVTAPGFRAATGTVTFSPSAIVFMGAADMTVAEFVTTPRGPPHPLALRPVRVEPNGKIAGPQYVRGGLAVESDLDVSDRTVGSVTPARVSFGPTSDSASVRFVPSSAGKATILARVPPGFRPASFGSIIANVRKPGLAIATGEFVGENLQLASAFSLGEPAPAEGLKLVITSSQPDKLLLSESGTENGSASITILVPPGGVSGTYYLQGLARSGAVNHTASAPGYVSRTGTINLAPAVLGFLMDKQGGSPESEAASFVTSLSERHSTRLLVRPAFSAEEPARFSRAAVQQIRPGFDLTVGIHNSNAQVGAVDLKVTIGGGMDHALVEFKPLAVGKTAISLKAGESFVAAPGAAEVEAVVVN